MIAKLKGQVDQIGDGFLVIDVQGVGYVAQASNRTLSNLREGEAATLFIEMLVREDSITLFAFIRQDEREWFRLLQSVQGVGAKVALAILAVLPPNKLALALAAQDKAAIGQANGVGPKLASRIVMELKDKAASLPVSGGAPALASVDGHQADADKAAVSDEGHGPIQADAISALENLGYARAEAYQAVAKASAELGGEADVSALISAALKTMNRP